VQYACARWPIRGVRMPVEAVNEEEIGIVTVCTHFASSLLESDSFKKLVVEKVTDTEWVMRIQASDVEDLGYHIVPVQDSES
jgi:hypothetical protein